MEARQPGDNRRNRTGPKYGPPGQTQFPEIPRMSAAPKTFVLIHGFWHGAWCWKYLAPLLTAPGHRVHALSYTGMGERAHLLASGISIDTFVDDVVGVIEAEELENVILVAHSFGGVPATGVAARIPQRLAHLVYLDAGLVLSGESAADTHPPAAVQERLASAAAAGGLAVPVPTRLPDSWGLAPGTPDYDWVLRRLTPQPLGSYTTPLHYAGPPGNGVPATYIECTAPPTAMQDVARKRAAALPGWRYLKMATPHDAMITHPREVAEILLAL